ncbi:hypothetical protein BHE74_00043950, partial [Ensete ventricosum]
VKMAEDTLCRVTGKSPPFCQALSPISTINVPCTRNSSSDATSDTAVVIQDDSIHLSQATAHNKKSNTCLLELASAPLIKDVTHGTAARGKRNRAASMKRVASLESLQNRICNGRGPCMPVQVDAAAWDPEATLDNKNQEQQSSGTAGHNAIFILIAYTYENLEREPYWPYEKLRISITGAGGFIASHIARRLKSEGHYIIASDWKKNEHMTEGMFCHEFHLVDLRVMDNCLKVTSGADHVFNLAADMGGMGFIQSNHSVIMYNNTMISFNMLEAARINGVKRFEMWGDGLQTRSFTFIDECVEGVLRLTKSDFREPVNIGSDEMVSMNEMVEIVLSFEDKKLPIHHIPGPEGVRGRNSDNTLIEEKLGWAPTMKLKVLN